jgi:hypothetical protein
MRLDCLVAFLHFRVYAPSPEIPWHPRPSLPPCRNCRLRDRPGGLLNHWGALRQSQPFRHRKNLELDPNQRGVLDPNQRADLHHVAAREAPLENISCAQMTARI